MASRSEAAASDNPMMTGGMRAGSQPALRFAPSPTGELHLGHALSALTTWEWASRLDGRFLLRIEDIDTGRARDHLIEQISEDLAWLGLQWETPVLRQSEHFTDYRAAARKLEDMGLLYACFATRSDIRAEVERLNTQGIAVPRDPDGAPVYPGLHKELPAGEIAARIDKGEPHALRLDMAAAIERAREITGQARISYVAFDDDGRERRVVADPARWGDAVIVRKDVPASYHLAVVVDDHRQGITHVTRGKDLEAATDLHRLLQELFGFEAPRYHHHRLLLDKGGAKLAKRSGSESLRSLREKGLTPEDIRRMITAV